MHACIHTYIHTYIQTYMRSVNPTPRPYFGVSWTRTLLYRGSCAGSNSCGRHTLMGVVTAQAG